MERHAGRVKFQRFYMYSPHSSRKITLLRGFKCSSVPLSGKYHSSFLIVSMKSALEVLASFDRGLHHYGAVDREARTSQKTLFGGAQAGKQM